MYIYIPGDIPMIYFIYIHNKLIIYKNNIHRFWLTTLFNLFVFFLLLCDAIYQETEEKYHLHESNVIRYDAQEIIGCYYLGAPYVI